MPKKSQWEEIKNLRRLWPFLKTEPAILSVTLLLIPVISIVQLAQPLVLKNAIDKGVISGDSKELSFFAFTYFILVVCEYISRASQSICSTVLVENMIKNMREKLVSHLMRQSLNFHHRNLSGVLVTRTTSDFDNLSESLSEGVLQSIVGVVSIIGCVVGMVSLHPTLGILSTLSIPIMIYCITWFSQKIKLSLHDARRYLASLNAYTQECLQGISSVKVLSAEKSVNEKFKGLNEDFRKAQMNSVTFDAVLFSILEGSSSVIIGLMLWVILTRVNVDTTLSAGVIVAFVRYLLQMFDPLKQLGQTVAFLQGVFTSTDRIFSLFDQNERIQGDKVLDRIEGHIVFENVAFVYPKASEENTKGFSLENINLQIKKGQSLALVGPTGGGKSTLIKLLTKQYEGYSGNITIDGVDISTLEPFALRNKIGIVPQDLVLFGGSIGFNIGLNHPDVSFEDIKRASKLMGLHPFVQTLPGAYDYLIQEDGSNLSVGQKQLIVFARALARNPHLIILDEATSALDPLSESMVQRALDNIFKLKTVIVIAHRLSTIRHCNKIAVVHNGKIMEEGGHEELIAREGLYHHLSLSLI